MVIAAFSGSVYAQTSTQAVKPAGSSALERARAAWEGGDFDLVAGLYSDALIAGGLTHGEVVSAYARMGAALAVTGKTRQALAALRTAALLDPDFTLPGEAGKKAMKAHSSTANSVVGCSQFAATRRVNKSFFLPMAR